MNTLRNRNFTRLTYQSIFFLIAVVLSIFQPQIGRAQYYASVEYQSFYTDYYSVEKYSAVIPELQRIIAIDAHQKPTKTVLERIANKAGLGIAYNAELPFLNREITLNTNAITVAEALQRVLEGTGFEAAISKMREIVFRKRLIPKVEEVKPILVQEISGAVTDSKTGTPLVGVNVYVMGTSIGTATNEGGRYSLEVPDNVDSLRFTYIGYKAQYIAINGRSVINVQMVPSVQQFDELVVTALGITRRERSVGYATQQVEGEDLSFTNEMNVIGSLSGKIAGLRVTGSSGAQLGGASVVQIRGVSSISGGDSPLIVVNGTPISNRRFGGSTGTDYGNIAQDINPSAIKSVSVLKGPAATALYGIRGQNGVIIYTTKDGAGVEGFTVEVNTGLSIQKTYNFFQTQNIYGGGYSQEFETLPNGQPFVEIYADESWGPKMGEDVMVREFFSFYPQDPMYGKLTPFSAHPDNIKKFYETGVTNNFGITVAGGANRSNYRLSFNRTDISGVYPNTELGRVNLGLSAAIDATDRWTFSTDISYASNDASRPTQGSESGRGYLKQWFQRQISMERMKNYRYPDGTVLHWNMQGPSSATGEIEDRSPLYWANPYWSAYKNTTHDFRDRLFGNIGFSFDAAPFLAITGHIRGDMYIQNIEGKTAVGGGETPGYSVNKYQNMEMNYELNAKFNQTWDELSLSATVGTNLFHRTYSSLEQATAGGLISPGYYNIDASVDRPEVDSYKLEKKILSAYGLVTLGYNATYFLSASMRGDKTSTLPENNNTYWYPSVSGSFVFSELINWEPLSFGKLRLSYAQAGDDLSPYQTSTIYGIGTVYNGIKTLYIPNEINNPNIKPNISKSYEVGVDLNFFGRLGIHATYYLQKSENQIISLNISGTSGYGSAIINAGLIENKGFELSLTGRPIQTTDFTWNAIFNISKNINKVVRLHPDIDLYKHAESEYSSVKTFLNSYEGGPYGVLVGVGYQRDEATGKILVGDDGMPLYTEANQKFGSILPDFVGGFQNIFNYKNFSLSTMISFQAGGQFFSRTLLLSRKTGIAPITAAINDNGNNVRDPVSEGGGVKISGISAATGQPVTTYVDAHDYYNNIMGDKIYEWTVVDASYIKLDEIRLGYNFGQNLIEALPVKSIEVAVFARNPVMIWQKAPQGINPSIMQGWYESSQLPSVRTFGFNLNFTF